MSSSKGAYPERLPSPRPKKPLKGRGRPSSTNSTKKAKVFHTMTVNGKDIKVGGCWYQSPHRKDQRDQSLT